MPWPPWPAKADVPDERAARLRPGAALSSERTTSSRSRSTRGCCLWVAPAVAQAAADSGGAREPIENHGVVQGLAAQAGGALPRPDARPRSAARGTPHVKRTHRVSRRRPMPRCCAPHASWWTSRSASPGAAGRRVADPQAEAEDANLDLTAGGRDPRALPRRAGRPGHHAVEAPRAQGRDPGRRSAPPSPTRSTSRL